jgi:aminopeptidase N
MEAAGEALDLFSTSFGPYPYPELTLVTVPRDSSQSLPGIVTLSDLMIADLGALGPLLGVEDRRTVVAHEVAHQWWGHEVGWSSYRDQWLSEALANWSAMLYAFEMREKRPQVRPTMGWRSELTATIADGRRVESVGPVTLGVRLESTLAEGAYYPIVYKKGAIVIDMLAQAVGREQLTKALHDLFGLAAGNLISTEVFIAALQRSAGVELGGFARQFVYGTGLPELSYEYSFASTTPGHWKVSGTVHQRLPRRHRCRVEAVGPQGRLDVLCEARGNGDVAEWWLLAPFEIGFGDPPKARRTDVRDADDVKWSRTVSGQVLVKGESSPFELEVDNEPRTFWLDRDAVVLATIYDDTKDVKHCRYRQGVEAVMKGDLASAERLWREALGAKSLYDDDRDLVEQLDALIEVSMARARLAYDDDAAAAVAVARAARHLGRGALEEVRGEVDVVQSRFDLRAGRFGEAYRRLKKTVLRRGAVDDAEAYLLLAVAALESGERETFDDAVKAAEERGGDVTTLRKLAKARAAA